MRRICTNLRIPPAVPVPSVRVRRYRLIDLFAGCGGMTRGFVDSGRFEPIVAVESEPRAAETYAENFDGAHLDDRPIQQRRQFPPADVLDVWQAILTAAAKAEAS